MTRTKKQAKFCALAISFLSCRCRNHFQRAGLTPSSSATGDRSRFQPLIATDESCLALNTCRHDFHFFFVHLTQSQRSIESGRVVFDKNKIGSLKRDFLFRVTPFRTGVMRIGADFDSVAKHFAGISPVTVLEIYSPF